VSELVLWNGDIVDRTAVNFDSSNRAFRYGDGLFETIKVADSFPIFFRTHYSRLVRGIDALGMTIPEFFDLNFFKDKLLEVIDQNLIVNGTLRVQFIRSGKGVYTPESSLFDWLIEAVRTGVESPFYSEDAATYVIDIYSDVRKYHSPISFFKSSNALVYVLAGLAAKRKKVDNMIVQNNNNHCIETVAENLFLFKNGRVVTPPLSDGPIEGVMRTAVKKILKWNKIPFQEQSITIDDLLTAEECFLTNTFVGIQPVTQFRDKAYSSKFAIGLKGKLNERVAQLIADKKRR